MILTYTVTATDSQTPLSDTETVTVTITGTNDAPMISGGPDSANLNETDSGLTASDTLTLSDVDTTDRVSVSHSLAISGTTDRLDPAARSDATLEGMLTLAPMAPWTAPRTVNLTWTFNSGSEAFDYLATGETLIVTYTVSGHRQPGRHHNRGM